ncbi:rhamnogalacturonan acetylesterase [Neptunitalea lumnitzerae]|uniref:Rhamnogalacturonan acetylesterase n=1 Tax=Neptunitalea lumnitzerae TaxID=2965509 RepID=A0ABQ5MIT0_9FLAO|nr:rhamnogalacturonan acetylesterase [Neptunitalea sp. Y10]GLB49326.1 rhamnogalacturonan acetylesterase [Neptunitalea sp. Y10]
MYLKRKIVYICLCFTVTTYAQTISFQKSKKADYEVLNSVSFLENGQYGFDFNTDKNVEFTEEGMCINSSAYFSFTLPEGNYQVKVKLGSNTQDCNTTIKAESRQLMIAQHLTHKGSFETLTFNVHLHHKTIKNSLETVILKEREEPKMDWDKKLTLEFLGTTTIQNIKIKPIKNITTIFLAGDSTVTNQDVEPWASWGQFLPAYVNKKAVVANYAFSGASLQSFKGMKRLEKIVSLLQKGDYLLIEFGHNDEKIKGEGNGAYGLYTNLLKEFIQVAKSKGATPILLTPTQRRAFENDKLKPTHGDFPNAMRKVSEDLNVPLIDITQLTTYMYESWGDEVSRNAFVQYPAHTFPGQSDALEDNTHFNSFGANEISLAVIQDIKEQKLALAKYFKKGMPAYNAKQPNHYKKWDLPMSPRYDNTKPYGN